MAGVGKLELQLINSSDRIAELRAGMLALTSAKCVLADCSRLPGNGGVRWSTDTELASLADHDLLHCYVLYCGGVPCAMILGMYYRNQCYIESIHRAPMDPKLSPGTALMHLATEDLIRRGTTRVEFGYGSPGHKHSSIHTLQPRAILLLLRKTWPHRLLRLSHGTFRNLVRLKHKHFPRVNGINQVDGH